MCSPGDGNDTTLEANRTRRRQCLVVVKFLPADSTSDESLDGYHGNAVRPTAHDTRSELGRASSVIAHCAAAGLWNRWRRSFSVVKDNATSTNFLAVTGYCYGMRRTSDQRRSTGGESAIIWKCEPHNPCLLLPQWDVQSLTQSVRSSFTGTLSTFTHSSV